MIRGHTGDHHVRWPSRGRASVVVQQDQALKGTSRPSGRQLAARAASKFKPRAAARRHLCSLGALPRVPPLAQPRDPLPGRARLCRDHHGQPGRQVVPRRQGLSTSTRRPARSPMPTRAGPRAGKSAATARQAQPGHRLEGRRRRLAAPARRTTRSSKATGSTARTRLHRLE